jgi:peptidyl-prolyl cis-trans isomerase C
MPTAFANALTALKPGKYTTTPVKTDFGWHVIQLEANRPIQPPPFEGVREQLMQGLTEQAINQHLAELQKRAKIEFKK